MEDEMVDIVDESGKVLRQALKVDAHKHGWLHKCVIGYLRDGGGDNNNNWKLVAQAPHKQDAGQYVAPVGGHAEAGESEIDALLRECEEEIGTRNITHKPIGKIVFHRQIIGRDENHLFSIYEISTNDKIRLNEESVSIKEFTNDSLKKALVVTPEKFGDAFYFILEKYYPEYLPSTWVRRWDK